MEMVLNPIIILLVFIVVGFVFFYWNCLRVSGGGRLVEGFNVDYLATLQKHKDEGGHFPYRYLCDENQKILPIVFVVAFFRDDKERITMYNEYVENGIDLVGITAYKTFPKPITDKTGDSETQNDPFDYYGKIQNWLSCFEKPSHYGFLPTNRLANISESDFYDAETTQVASADKKYDFIYVCLADDNKTCPMDGWNAVNRNFALALKCFPIMIDEMGLKVLVVGRVGCGLEKLYGDKITVVDFLPYHEFQDKLRESRYLFVPNVYDASPRVISESIVKGLYVLLNRNIVCGAKYVTEETGELFTDENDIRLAIQKLMAKKTDSQKWWSENYSKKKSGKK